ATLRKGGWYAERGELPGARCDLAAEVVANASENCSKREIDLLALQRHRPPSRDAQRRWLLHAQYDHEEGGGHEPMTHPQQERRCPDWPARLDEAEHEGLLVLRAGKLSLTDAGREHVQNERTRLRNKLPEDPDLRVHVGTIGTGKAVQKDPELFARLRRV